MAVEKKFVPGKGLVPVGKEEAGKKGAVPPAKGKGKEFLPLKAKALFLLRRAKVSPFPLRRNRNG